MNRTIRRRVRHERRASLIRREADEDSPPARSIAAEEVQREVRAALMKLKTKHREVLTFHLIERLSYDAISQRLGVPVGTVRSRLSRAREALTTYLSPDFHEAP